MIFLSRLHNITVQPFYNIINAYISDVIHFSLRSTFSWKTSNYADSYWFLYTTKQDVMIKRTLNS